MHLCSDTPPSIIKHRRSASNKITSHHIEPPASVSRLRRYAVLRGPRSCLRFCVVETLLNPCPIAVPVPSPVRPAKAAPDLSLLLRTSRRLTESVTGLYCSCPQSHLSSPRPRHPPPRSTPAKPLLHINIMTPSPSSSSLARLDSIANHISPAMVSTTNFPAETVPQAPEDALFGLARAFKADTSPIKVDLVCRSARSRCIAAASIALFGHAVPGNRKLNYSHVQNRELARIVLTRQSLGYFLLLKRCVVLIRSPRRSPRPLR